MLWNVPSQVERFAAIYYNKYFAICIQFCALFLIHTGQGHFFPLNNQPRVTTKYRWNAPLLHIFFAPGPHHLGTAVCNLERAAKRNNRRALFAQEGRPAEAIKNRPKVEDARQTGSRNLRPTHAWSGAAMTRSRLRGDHCRAEKGPLTTPVTATC